MNSYHLEILDAIKQAAKNPGRDRISNSYHGNHHTNYLLNNPQKRHIAKKWANEHKNIELPDFISLLNVLYSAPSYEEKSIAGMLLEYLPKLTVKLDPFLLDKWLNHLEGWAEIDGTCQSGFKHAITPQTFTLWRELIEQFRESKQIAKRRASLVLLTKPVEIYPDIEFADLAFETMKMLQIERDILITKAISWLLRSLVKNHEQLVAEFLDENKNELPKIAIRETTRKLATGKK